MIPQPRPEYPRPQFAREEWLCLNGEWGFEVDPRDDGVDRGLASRALAGTITVPFCPESTLSGIGDVEFVEAVWYRREVFVPGAWAGRRVLLHFQAVDHDATVWVDGREVARHRGGFTPFRVDLGVGEAGRTHTIVVRAQDHRDGPKARGKQSLRDENHACWYTRTTGIWQTVWMEPVAARAALQRPRLTPDVAAGEVRLEQRVDGDPTGLRIRAILSDAAGPVSEATGPLDLDFTASLCLAIPPPRRRPWGPGHPHLYELQIDLEDGPGAVIDRVQSYAGLRSVGRRGQAITINGEPVFQRLVLDQGYWEDGIMTAPTDAHIVADIELGMAAGFNGARLHQKVFEERYLYHADRLGYLVWGEFPDWGGIGHTSSTPGAAMPVTYVAQWLEAVERDYSHPSIVGWCPLNETGPAATSTASPDTLTDETRALFLATRAADRTRPILDTSGYSHRVIEADVFDSHDYEQDPGQFAANHAGTRVGRPLENTFGGRAAAVPYDGQPVFVSEFGGIWWNPDARPGEDSWGYGDRPRSVEEFHVRFEGLCQALLDDPAMFGYCYTQLTDVFQEQNGIFRFDRTPKFDLDRIRAAQVRPAAIEALAPEPAQPL